MRQTGQARLDEALSRQAVEHHVNALAVGGFEDFPSEPRLAAVEHVLHAQGPQVSLLRGAGGSEYLRARGMRKLDGGEADAARAGVNQHPLAGLQIRQVER